MDEQTNDNFDHGRIKGLANFDVEVFERIALDNSNTVLIQNGNIHFKQFPSGSVVAFK